MSIIFSQFLVGSLFISMVFLHIAKKNIEVAITYGIQSLLVALILFNAFLETGFKSLLLIAFIMILVKVILAPMFIIKLIKKNGFKFSVATYFNVPITLIVIAILTTVAHSDKFSALVNIVPANNQFLSIIFSALLISLFLIVNRKGALAQIIGVLALENCIVAFAFFAGLEQAPALQIGIIFNISVWIVIATIFVSMMYQHFKTINVTEMKRLKD